MYNSFYNRRIFHSWYVFHLQSNREKIVMDVVRKNIIEPLDIIFFTQERIHRLKCKLIKNVRPLFPGYLFVHKKPALFIQTVKKYLPGEFVNLVHVKLDRRKIILDNDPSSKACSSTFQSCCVNENEMRFLLSNTTDTGVFRLLQAYSVEDRIVFKNGIFKEMSGKIKWINKRKRKVCVDLSSSDSLAEMKVILGFELLQFDQVTGQYDKNELRI